MFQSKTSFYRWYSEYIEPLILKADEEEDLTDDEKWLIDAATAIMNYFINEEE